LICSGLKAAVNRIKNILGKTKTCKSTQNLGRMRLSETQTLLDWNPCHPLVSTAPLPDAPSATPLIAQQLEDNLWNNLEGTFNNFVESGQAWTLLWLILDM